MLKERRPRSTHEFLNDQAIWEHKKLTELQNAIIQKEQQAQEEDKKFGFKPTPNKLSAKLAEQMNLDEKVEQRLGNRTYRNSRLHASRQSYQVQKESELIFTPRISKAA